MDSKQTIQKLTILAFVPVILIEVSLSPNWFQSRYENLSSLINARDLLTALIMPLYLSIIGVMFIWSRAFISAIYVLVILFSSVIFSVLLEYSVWGLSTGRFWQPDGETIALVIFTALIALGITLFPPIYAGFIRALICYFNRHALTNHWSER